MAVRLDKFLWAVRIYKTRTDAADACKGNKVKVSGVSAKPSKEILPGNRIEVRKGAVTYTYEVKSLLSSRVGASLVPEYVTNLTPESELAKLKSPVETFFLKRDKGSGRPTKKERREIDEMTDSINYDDEIPDDIALKFGITDEDF